MKGFQRTRTKAQDLTEIVSKQDGFLGGLNSDNPKSEVGDTQVTVLNNAIPFRDRIEARAGIKPLTGYVITGEDDEGLHYETDQSPFYNQEFDEFFFNPGVADPTIIENRGHKGREVTKCFGYPFNDGTDPDLFLENFSIKDSIFFSSYTDVGGGIIRNNIIEYRKDYDDYFVRPLNDNCGKVGGINVSNTSTGAFSYTFQASFVRIINGVVLAESKIQTRADINFLTEFDDTVKYLSLDNAQYYPDELFDTASPFFSGTDNFYTHARYYRSTIIDPAVVFTTAPDYGIKCYHVGDYPLNDIPSLSPGVVFLDLNVSDSTLISDSSRATIWQAGYQPIYGSNIATNSSGIFICRNESKKNEFIYCPIGSGDNQKYFGWYNPLFQYGSVDGDITSLTDMGTYVLITTRTKSYYVDTVNYIEDESQRALGIFTPILNQAVLISSSIGIEFNQRKALVSSYTGTVIGVTNEGEIRQFSNYQWGVDLSSNKVSSITKGIILNNNSYCQAAFINDSYYLGYETGEIVDGLDEYKTLRLGTTEEAGNGFCEFGGGRWDIGEGTTFFYNVKGKLNVLVKYRTSPTVVLKEICEYSGDKFDNKLTKDIIDVYESGVYSETIYSDIPCEIEFPEVTAASESYFLYFLKAHFFLRADRYSYKVANETLKGYEIEDTDLSLISLSDIEFGMDARKGESNTIIESNNDFDAESGVTLSREVQDHRIRLTLRADSGGFQLTGMESHFKRHDRTQLNQTTSEQYIESLNSGLYCFIDETLKNNALGLTRGATFDIGAPIEGALLASNPEGLLIEGTEASLSIGPSGLTDGITLFDIATPTVYEFQLPYVADLTTATIMYWEKANTGSIAVGWSFSGLHKYEFFGSNSVAWKHVAHIYNGTQWDVYEDGALVSTSVEALRQDIKRPSVRIYGEGQLSDIRMYNKEVTVEELLFYINNILNDEGDYFNGY